MDKLKTYLVIWIAGWVACLIALERWRRIGAGASPEPTVAESAAAVAGVAGAEPGMPPRPKLTTLVVNGAKADYSRARGLLDRVMPGSSAPAAAGAAQTD